MFHLPKVYARQFPQLFHIKDWVSELIFNRLYKFVRVNKHYFLKIYFFIKFILEFKMELKSFFFHL